MNSDRRVLNRQYWNEKIVRSELEREKRRKPQERIELSTFRLLSECSTD